MSTLRKEQVLHETYRIRRLLARGGMGEVYEAEHVRLAHKRLAIKVLHEAVVEDPTACTRFVMEAEIVSGLKHPHIITITDFNELDSGQPYMVMEYLEGEELSVRLQRDGPLEPQEVALLLEQTASALSQVHEQGIIHRDLKPGNIFLVHGSDDAIHVKLLDFGISKIKNSQAQLTQMKTVLGTPHFMSPEQASGAIGEIDQTTDIFSLGAIAYVCLSGRLPFETEKLVDLVKEILEREPPPLDELVPGLSSEVDMVIRRAMAKAGEDRYQQAEELAAAFRQALESMELKAEQEGEADNQRMVLPAPMTISNMPAVGPAASPIEAPPAASPVEAPPATAPATAPVQFKADFRPLGGLGEATVAVPGEAVESERATVPIPGEAVEAAVAAASVAAASGQTAEKDAGAAAAPEQEAVLRTTVRLKAPPKQAAPTAIESPGGEVAPRDDAPTEILEAVGEVAAPRDEAPTEILEAVGEVAAPRDEAPTEILEAVGEVMAPRDEAPTEILEAVGEVMAPRDEAPTVAAEADDDYEATMVMPPQVRDERETLLDQSLPEAPSAQEIAAFRQMPTVTEAAYEEKLSDSALDDAPTDQVLDDAPTDPVLDNAPTDPVLDDAPTNPVRDGAVSDSALDDAPTDPVRDDAVAAEGPTAREPQNTSLVRMPDPSAASLPSSPATTFGRRWLILGLLVLVVLGGVGAWLLLS